jgi:hypothetical protein
MMVDGLHISRTMKPLAVTLSGAGGGEMVGAI